MTRPLPKSVMRLPRHWICCVDGALLLTLLLFFLLAVAEVVLVVVLAVILTIRALVARMVVSCCACGSSCLLRCACAARNGECGRQRCLGDETCGARVMVSRASCIDTWQFGAKQSAWALPSLKSHELTKPLYDGTTLRLRLVSHSIACILMNVLPEERN